MNKEDEELERIRQKRLMEMMLEIGGNNMSEKKEISLDKPIEVTDADFSDTIAKYPNVVIDCWAPWCGPCRTLGPIIDELAKDYAGRIVFGKLNVDNNQRTSIEFGIMSIPAILIFKDGELVDQQVGAMPRDMLEPIISKYL